MIRAGVSAILAAGGDFEVVAEAADGREAVSLAQAHVMFSAAPQRGRWPPGPA